MQEGQRAHAFVCMHSTDLYMLFLWRNLVLPSIWLNKYASKTWLTQRKQSKIGVGFISNNQASPNTRYMQLFEVSIHAVLHVLDAFFNFLIALIFNPPQSKDSGVVHGSEISNQSCVIGRDSTIKLTPDCLIWLVKSNPTSPVWVEQEAAGSNHMHKRCSNCSGYSREWETGQKAGTRANSAQDEGRGRFCQFCQQKIPNDNI